MKRTAARILIALLSFIGLGEPLLVQGADDPVSITPTKSATFHLPLPAAKAGVFLDIYLKSYQPPTAGSGEFVVTIDAPQIERRELARMSIFPAEAFNVTGERDQRAYRYDVTSALSGVAAGASVLVELSMRPSSSEPVVNGRLEIIKVELTPRL